MCLYTNATSLNNKLNDFKAEIVAQGFSQIVFVTETWFGENSVPFIDNYVLYRKDRKSRGGGVAIYVRENLCSYEVVSDRLNSKDVEQSWCEIRVGSENILVGCIYRAPKSDFANMKKITENLREAKRLVETKRFSNLLIT